MVDELINSVISLYQPWVTWKSYIQKFTIISPKAKYNDARHVLGKMILKCLRSWGQLYLTQKLIQIHLSQWPVDYYFWKDWEVHGEPYRFWTSIRSTRHLSQIRCHSFTIIIDYIRLLPKILYTRKTWVFPSTKDLLSKMDVRLGADIF